MCSSCCKTRHERNNQEPMGAPQGGPRPMGGSPFGPPECAAHAVKHGMNATIRRGRGGRASGRPARGPETAVRAPPPNGAGGVSRFEVPDHLSGPGQAEGLRGAERAYVATFCPRRSSEAAAGLVIAGFKGFGWRLERHSKSPPARVRWRTAVRHARFCGVRRAPHSRAHGGAERFRQRSGAPRWRPAPAAAMCAQGPHVDGFSSGSRARKLSHSCARTATR